MRIETIVLAFILLQTYQHNQYDSSRRSAKFRIFPKHSEESESKQEIEL